MAFGGKERSPSFRLINNMGRCEILFESSIRQELDSLLFNYLHLFAILLKRILICWRVLVKNLCRDDSHVQHSTLQILHQSFVDDSVRKLCIRLQTTETHLRTERVIGLSVYLPSRFGVLDCSQACTVLLLQTFYSHGTNFKSVAIRYPRLQRLHDDRY